MSDIKPNQVWLSEHSSKPVHSSQGQVIWLKDGKKVSNFELTKDEMKLLKKACREADREEAFAQVPVDVIVMQVNGKITILRKERENE